MLGTLRKHSRSVIIYVLFGVIIVVFVFTFNQAGLDTGCGGSGRAGSATSLAHAGDGDLDVSALSMGLALSADPPSGGSLGDPKAFQQELIYRSTRFARFRGDAKYQSFIPDPRAVSGLKLRKVADDLEETWLISDEATRRGLRASPEEIRARIVQDFSDSTSGFKKKSYEDWVRFGLRTSLARFEDFVRREILREKMIGVVVSGVTMSDREARYMASQRNAVRSYEFLEIDPSAVADALAKPLPVGAAPVFASAAPSAADVAAWLKDHEEDARRYFEGNKAEFRIDPTYEFHFMRFSAPSKRTVASIRDAEQRKALEGARDDSKARAEEAAKALAGEGRALVESFEKTATAKSDDAGSAARGGRVESAMPESAVKAMDPALAAALAAIEPGKASGVIEGDDAFFVALLDRATPGADRPYEAVRETIARKLVAKTKAPAAVTAVAEEALKLAAASPQAPLADVATALNAGFGDAAPVKLGETGDIPAIPATLSGLVEWSPDAVPGIGKSEELAAALRELTVSAPVAAKTHKVAGSEALHVARLKAATGASDPTPEDIEKAKSDFNPLKRQAVYREWYQGLKTAAAASGALVEHETLTTMIRDEVRNREETLKRAAKATPGNGAPPPPPEE
jgi:hypothetical protein